MRRREPIGSFRSRTTGSACQNADAGRLGPKKAGLGTSIVKALAQQLEAVVGVVSGPTGTTVSITRASLAAAHVPRTGQSHPGRVPVALALVGKRAPAQ